MAALLAEEVELLGDSKYRAYISQVEKALKNFEYTSEWADLISALGKLNKVLLAHVKYPVIPKRVTIGKRLAQCLHPALPSGVHLKALETYDIIFKCIGTQRLALDLFTYSAGLFPLLGYASMSVKPPLLALYENHFVPLGMLIKPGLTGLLLGLLPGLEEGSEYFERTNNLLEEFVEAADPIFFYGCLWECVLTSPAVRLSAVNFVLSHYNKKKTMEDQLYVIGSDIDLMVQALCLAVQDTSVLVQRSFLELLLYGFPMHNSQLTKPDMSKIVCAAVRVVSRRDMSLNRRLYSWLLGTDSSGATVNMNSMPEGKPQRKDSVSSSNADLDYFDTYSREYLVHAVHKLIDDNYDGESSDGKPANLKPFRILISLLDKPEIASAILEEVLIDVFRRFYRECSDKSESGAVSETSIYQSGALSSKAKFGRKVQDPKAKDQTGKSNSELIKTANLLFGTFEPYFIWDFIGKTFETTCASTVNRIRSKGQTQNFKVISVTELCELVDFLLDKISLETYPETQTEHLPELLRQITGSLHSHCAHLNETELTVSLKLCSKILSRVLPSMALVGMETTDEEDGQRASLHASPVKRASQRGSLNSSPVKQANKDKSKAAADHPEVNQIAEESNKVSESEEKEEVKEGREKESDVAAADDGNSVKASEDVAEEVKCPESNKSNSTDPVAVDQSNISTKVERIDQNSESEKGTPVKLAMPESESENYLSADSDVLNSDVFEEDAGFVDCNKDDAECDDTFCEFVAFQENGNSGNDADSVKPLTLMQACVQSFHALFCKFVSTKLIPDAEIPTRCMGRLLEKTVSAGTQTTSGNTRGDEFKSARSTSEDDESSKTWAHSTTGSSVTDEDEWVKLKENSRGIVEAFKCACQLLVDFSSFPMYCTDYHKILDKSFKEDSGFDFPDWLQLLLTCSCFVDHFDTQTAAISTMLDLISLTQSIISESESKDQEEGEEAGGLRRRSTTEGTVSVVIVPSISPRHLKFLNENTQFYRLIGQRLWANLSEATPMYHQRSVDLFSQLHQLAPSPWICEDVIGQELVSISQKKKIEAHAKYTILWHLTREMRYGTNPGYTLRTFDRSMCVMLDSLINDTSPTRALTQTWLTHSIQRGDVARILEPILLMLLHPDTARISIQHVSIHQPKKVKLSESADDNGSVVEAKIFAISSEGGNVIYHVSNQYGKPFSKKTTEELRSVALTTITESGSATHLTPKKGEVEMHFDKVNPNDLNLRMNPFGSESSLDKMIFEGYEPPSNFPDMSNMRRLDSQTCKKEGIFFDDNEEEKESNESDENAEDIVRSILDSIIEDATRDSKTSSETSSVFGDNNNKPVLDSNIEGHIGRKTRLGSVQSRDSSMGPDDLLNAIDSKVSEIDSQSDTDTEGNSAQQGARKEEIPGIHPLHTHILLYTQKYDAHRTLYSLTMLKAILSTSPRLVICAMATTSVSDTRTPYLQQLQALLARHRKSVFGKNFFTELTGDAMSSYRTCMYIEVLITMCLYFVRSYYPNLMMSKLSELELNGNKEVQILSTEILTLLLSEIINVARDSNKGFSTYVKDLLTRCKVQKAILHCVLASVYNARHKAGSENSTDRNLTDGIINFNEENMDANTNETFQIRLLKLVLVIIILEDHIRGVTKSDENITLDWERLRVNFQPELSFVRYQPGKPIVYQGMFLSAILSALKQQHLSHMHRHWVAMVTSALPYMGKALGHTTVSVVNQICRNLELLSCQFESGETPSRHNHPDRVPADHLLTMLEGLSTMCHYSLLDSSQQVSLGMPLPPSMSGMSSMMSDTATAGQILSNLIHVFNPINSREPSPAKDVSSSVQPVMEARRSLLSILPRIIAGLTILWKSLQVSEETKQASVKKQPSWIMGSPKSVRQYILEFLSPLSLHHGVNLLGAVAVVWNDRRQRGLSSSKRVIPSSCEDQLLLVDLVSAIRVMPTDTLIQTITKVIKQPPPTNLDRHRKRTPLEVSMLQFFYAYIQRTSVGQLVDSWPSLLALLKDGLQLSLPPPGQFLLLGILNEFVQKMPMFEERRNQKDLQDVAQKLLEAVSTIAGASLEQTTWLRRNLAVKPGPQVDITEQEEPDVPTDVESDDVMPAPPVEPQPAQHNYRQYSVQALVMLAELIAPLLDVIYSSDEKDRVVPFLNSMMHSVFPYLKNHSTHNLPSFRACSQIVASLSGYQYTRKTWKREVFELVMDTSFFQMDSSCVEYWRVIIDNLMTHDKITFKDLITRVTVTPSGSLNLFSSRDQEFELRAQHLKRLTFAIFCSDQDQYHRFMPDVQERLSDSLRFPHVPTIQAQVFLFFRVLILRMSPLHVTSLWPTIITELVQVLLQIEQEIGPEIDENSLTQRKRSRAQLARLANLDASWSMGNGLNNHSSGGWLQLYLAACKLLDLALALPAASLPQFQLYKWAFVGDTGIEGIYKQRRENPRFIPHVMRIAKLMNRKYVGEPPVLAQLPGCPLLTVSSIRSIQDLHGFFNTLALSAQSSDSFTTLTQSAAKSHPAKSLSTASTNRSMPKSQSQPEFQGLLSDSVRFREDITAKEYIERIIEQDFLEPLPRS